MDLNLMKRVLSLLLALVLLIGNVPAVAFATEEIEEETVAETLAETVGPTKAVTEPVMETSASTEAATEEPVKETVAPTMAATKPATEPVQETVAPTEAATEPVVEETTAPTLPAVPEETVAPAEPAEGEAITDPVKTEFQFTVSDMDLPTNEELHTAYAEHVLYGTQIATFGTAAGERLTGDEKLLYDAMVPLIKQIASGERASTVIGVGQTVTSGGVTYEPDSEVTFTGAPLDQEAMTRVFDALLSDLPYEMYWFDKTAAGEGFAFTMDGVFVYGQQSLPVAGNYRGADTYTVDTAKTGAAAAAAGNAENIVAKYAASSDYEKLVGYRDEICALVSYNFDALNMDFNEDNDPWQLIYVFDEDESTNVVCEGYSKAFMYLCDKTNFAGDVSCHTVSGQMNGGNHMWNVVTIEGSNYLVDVTNSDGGMAGQNGGLFLAGGTGNASSTYNVMNIYYAYNIRTKNFWGTGADSILTLASENYTPQTGGGEDEDTIVSGDWGSNITWVFDRSTGTLTLSGEGEMDSTLVRDTPWRNNFDQDIINLVIGEGITNIGGSTFNSCVNLQNVQIPNSVTSIDWGAFGNCDSLTEISIPFGVTTIAGSAFEDCDGLIAITIPASVTTIGEHAFFRCTGLKSITFEGDAPVFETEEDGSIYTFGVVTATAYYPANNPTWTSDVMQNYGGTITWTPVGGAGEIIIANGTCGENVTWMLDDKGVLTISGTGDMVIDVVPWRDYREFITAVVIQEGVTSIDDDAFYRCSSLTNIAIPDGVTSIGDYAFKGCESLRNITLPDDVTHIGKCAFYYCSNLAGINLPDGVTYIGGGAFFSCRSLTSVDIPDSVTSIGSGAFAQCSSLTSIVIPDSVTCIDDHAFYLCGTLQTITIGSGVSSIGEGAFAECANLEGIWVSEENPSYYSDACGALYNKNMTELMQVPARHSGVYAIPAGVTSIADEAFVWCEKLTDVIIPDGVTSIGRFAFWECRALTNVNIPDSVSTIEYGAFNECSSLESIVIPDSVTEIGDYAFDWCSNLKHVTIGSGITAIGEGVFSLCYNLTSIRIPDSVTSIDVNAFRNSATPTDIYYGGSQAQWSAVTNRPVAEYVHYSCEDLSRHWRTVTVDPTYTAGGYSYEYCSCGYERNNVITGNALGLPKPVVQAISDSVTGGATLRWEHDGEADRYEVYRATSKSGKYTRLVSVPSSTVMVSVSPGKTYYYKVKAICDANSKLSSGYSNVVKVTGRCAQPEITAAVHASSGKPMITWGKIGGAKKYEVYRATEENGTYTKVKTTTSTTYTDTSATVGTTYFYKVKAIASKSAHNSIDSAAKSCRTLCAQPAVTLKINADTGKPAFSWKAVSGAVQYEIIRAESVDGTFVRLAVLSDLWFEDGTAAPDKDYWYKVNALNAEGADSVDGTTKKIHATLAKPGVTFAIDEVSGKPVLTWEAVEGAVQYKVYRSTSAKKSYKAIATVTDTEYVATSASVGKGYYYKVIAIGETAESAYSSYKKLTAKCAQPVITVEASETSGKPVIKWSKVSGAKKYYVYRVDEVTGTRTSIGSTTKTTFTDSKAVHGTTYTYQVRANGPKSAYNSIYSEIKSCLTILGKPVVTAKNDAATGKVILSWKAIPGATAYEVYRTGDDGILCQMCTQSALTYTDEGEGTDVDTVYTYKVRAITGEPALDSADSNEVTTSAVCARPVASIALNGKKPMVTWESVEGATKYYVYRSTKKSSGYKKVATVEEDTYTDTKAKKGTTYYYKVVAVSENATSAQSAYVKIKSK